MAGIVQHFRNTCKRVQLGNSSRNGPLCRYL